MQSKRYLWTALILLVTTAYGIQSSLSHVDWEGTFQEILSSLKKENHPALSNKTAMVSAFNSFIRAIDPYASFLDQTTYTQLLETTKGGLTQLGITLGPKDPIDDFLMVLAVKKNSPADQAGIVRYDRIKAINGIPVAPFSLEENSIRLRDSYTNSVALLITREHREPQTYILKPSFIEKKSCSSSFIEDHSILYCAVKLFTRETATELKKAVTQRDPKKVRGLIIDLRDNRGGLLEAAIDCAALFVEKNTLIVSTKNLQGESISHYKTEHQPVIRGTPLIILINKGTASAAEVFAQALRLYAAQSTKKQFVALVGTPTAGKGSLQKIQPIAQGYALKITTAYSSMADGSCFHAKGLSPDFYSEESSLQKDPEMVLHQKNSLMPLNQIPFFKHTSKNHSILLSDQYITCGCTLIALLHHLQKHTPQFSSSYKTQLSWLQAHYYHPKK